MDLLKGITEELGHGERDAPNDRDRDGDRARSQSTPEPTPRETDERTRDDEHVCDFCGTDFPAGRGACPDCGAEIIVRGAR